MADKAEIDQPVQRYLSQNIPQLQKFFYKSGNSVINRYKTRRVLVEFSYDILHLVVSFWHWICTLATFWQNYYGVTVNLTYESVTVGTVDRFFIIDIHGIV